MLMLPTKEMVNGCLLYKLITPSGSAHEWRHKSKNLVHALTHHHLLEITQVCCPGHLVTLSHSLSHSHAGLTSRRSRRPDSDWDRSLDPELNRGPGPGRWLEECRDSNCGFIDKWILQQRGSCVYLNVQWLTFIPRTITVTAFPQIDTSPRGLYVKYSAESSGCCQTSGMLGAWNILVFDSELCYDLT